MQFRKNDLHIVFQTSTTRRIGHFCIYHLSNWWCKIVAGCWKVMKTNSSRGIVWSFLMVVWHVSSASACSRLLGRLHSRAALHIDGEDHVGTSGPQQGRRNGGGEEENHPNVQTMPLKTWPWGWIWLLWLLLFVLLTLLLLLRLLILVLQY